LKRKGRGAVDVLIANRCEHKHQHGRAEHNEQQAQQDGEGLRGENSQKGHNHR
jgi:hypothetical protein